MPETNHSLEAQLTAYLKGELPTAERDALEARLLEDAELFALLESLEEDLLDQFAGGELTPALQNQLRQRVRMDPALERKLAVSEALHAYFETSRQASPNPVVTGLANSQPPLRTRLTRWFFSRQPRLRLALTVLAAGILVFVISGSTLVLGSRWFYTTFHLNGTRETPAPVPEKAVLAKPAKPSTNRNQTTDPFLELPFPEPTERAEPPGAKGLPPADDPFSNTHGFSPAQNQPADATPPPRTSRIQQWKAKRPLKEFPGPALPETSEPYLIDEVRVIGMFEKSDGLQALVTLKEGKAKFFLKVGSRFWNGSVLRIEKTPNSHLDENEMQGMVVCEEWTNGKKGVRYLPYVIKK
ncbi:MAG: hypothetical protein K1Y36_09540 [Blastocatellia bacterium]|nr:hypothetical protein [Blastocatellia bacterium]